MGKSKKKKEAGPKVKRDVHKIDERVKSIQNLQPPDENPWKMDNEKRIDQFLKYGFKKKIDYSPPKTKNRNRFT